MNLLFAKHPVATLFYSPIEHHVVYRHHHRHAFLKIVIGEPPSRLRRCQKTTSDLGRTSNTSISDYFYYFRWNLLLLHVAYKAQCYADTTWKHTCSTHRNVVYKCKE